MTTQTSEIAGPFLRWAGAKRAYVELLKRFVPLQYHRYYEPFLGGGALFFSLAPQSATLGDQVAPLVSAFRAVRDGPRAVHNYILQWPVDRETYYRVRSLTPRTRFEAAAQFIYLNKTAWNGLYRVNSAGTFNVPYGAPKSSSIVSSPLLHACSGALRRTVTIRHADFERTLATVGPDDFVFLDPPYVTGHKHNGFVDYNERLFSWADQERLARTVRRLAQQGTAVLLTNADHVRIRELYHDFALTEFTRHSTLASLPKHRRPVTELIIATRARP